MIVALEFELLKDSVRGIDCLSMVNHYIILYVILVIIVIVALEFEYLANAAWGI